jgi:hypothetical protein
VGLLRTGLFGCLYMCMHDQQQLTAALHSACSQLGLQPRAPFLGKAAQLHDTLGVRFGVMLVGPAGEGLERMRLQAWHVRLRLQRCCVLMRLPLRLCICRHVCLVGPACRQHL